MWSCKESNSIELHSWLCPFLVGELQAQGLALEGETPISMRVKVWQPHLYSGDLGLPLARHGGVGSEGVVVVLGWGPARKGFLV